MVQDLFDALAAQPVVAVVIVLAVVVAVAVLVGGARLPRWIRVRRRLAAMVDAERAEIQRITAAALTSARQAPPLWACTECTTRGLCAITGCKRAQAVDS